MSTLNPKSKGFDKNFRDGDHRRHPDFEPWLCFNDHPKSVTLYFKSMYDDDAWCLKHKGITPRQMHAIAPDLYAKNESEMNKLIQIKKGSFGRLPHSFYERHTLDGSPGTYLVRNEGSL